RTLAVYAVKNVGHISPLRIPAPQQIEQPARDTPLAINTPRYLAAHVRRRARGKCPPASAAPHAARMCRFETCLRNGHTSNLVLKSLNWAADFQGRERPYTVNLSACVLTFILCGSKPAIALNTAHAAAALADTWSTQRSYDLCRVFA